MFPIIKGCVWFYPEAIDFRKGLQGLVELVALDLEQNPGNGDIYVFRSKRSSQVKMIFWQNNGFWLCHKRMEKIRFSGSAQIMLVRVNAQHKSPRDEIFVD